MFNYFYLFFMRLLSNLRLVLTGPKNSAVAACIAFFKNELQLLKKLIVVSSRSDSLMEFFIRGLLAVLGFCARVVFRVKLVVWFFLPRFRNYTGVLKKAAGSLLGLSSRAVVLPRHLTPLSGEVSNDDSVRTDEMSDLGQTITELNDFRPWLAVVPLNSTWDGSLNWGFSGTPVGVSRATFLSNGPFLDGLQRYSDFKARYAFNVEGSFFSTPPLKGNFEGFDSTVLGLDDFMGFLSLFDRKLSLKLNLFSNQLFLNHYLTKSFFPGWLGNGTISDLLLRGHGTNLPLAYSSSLWRSKDLSAKPNLADRPLANRTEYTVRLALNQDASFSGYLYKIFTQDQEYSWRGNLFERYSLGISGAREFLYPFAPVRVGARASVSGLGLLDRYSVFFPWLKDTNSLGFSLQAAKDRWGRLIYEGFSRQFFSDYLRMVGRSFYDQLRFSKLRTENYDETLYGSEFYGNESPYLLARNRFLKRSSGYFDHHLDYAAGASDFRLLKDRLRLRADDRWDPRFFSWRQRRTLRRQAPLRIFAAIRRERDLNYGSLDELFNIQGGPEKLPELFSFRRPVRYGYFKAHKGRQWRHSAQRIWQQNVLSRMDLAYTGSIFFEWWPDFGFDELGLDLYFVDWYTYDLAPRQALSLRQAMFWLNYTPDATDETAPGYPLAYPRTSIFKHLNDQQLLRFAHTGQGWSSYRFGSHGFHDTFGYYDPIFSHHWAWKESARNSMAVMFGLLFGYLGAFFGKTLFLPVRLVGWLGWRLLRSLPALTGLLALWGVLLKFCYAAVFERSRFKLTDVQRSRAYFLAPVIIFLVLTLVAHLLIPGAQLLNLFNFLWFHSLWFGLALLFKFTRLFWRAAKDLPSTQEVWTFSSIMFMFLVFTLGPYYFSRFFGAGLFHFRGYLEHRYIGLFFPFLRYQPRGHSAFNWELKFQENEGAPTPLQSFDHFHNAYTRLVSRRATIAYQYDHLLNVLIPNQPLSVKLSRSPVFADLSPLYRLRHRPFFKLVLRTNHTISQHLINNTKLYQSWPDTFGLYRREQLSYQSNIPVLPVWSLTGFFDRPGLFDKLFAQYRAAQFNAFRLPATNEVRPVFLLGALERTRWLNKTEVREFVLSPDFTGQEPRQWGYFLERCGYAYITYQVQEFLSSAEFSSTLLTDGESYQGLVPPTLATVSPATPSFRTRFSPYVHRFFFFAPGLFGPRRQVFSQTPLFEDRFVDLLSFRGRWPFWFLRSLRQPANFNWLTRYKEKADRLPLAWLGNLIYNSPLAFYYPHTEHIPKPPLTTKQPSPVGDTLFSVQSDFFHSQTPVAYAGWLQLKRALDVYEKPGRLSTIAHDWLARRASFNRLSSQRIPRRWSYPMATRYWLTQPRQYLPPQPHRNPSAMVQPTAGLFSDDYGDHLEMLSDHFLPMPDYPDEVDSHYQVLVNRTESLADRSILAEPIAFVDAWQPLVPSDQYLASQASELRAYGEHDALADFDVTRWTADEETFYLNDPDPDFLEENYLVYHSELSEPEELLEVEETEIAYDDLSELGSYLYPNQPYSYLDGSVDPEVLEDPLSENVLVKLFTGMEDEDYDAAAELDYEIHDEDRELSVEEDLLEDELPDFYPESKPLATDYYWADEETVFPVDESEFHSGLEPIVEDNSYFITPVTLSDVTFNRTPASVFLEEDISLGPSRSEGDFYFDGLFGDYQGLLPETEEHYYPVQNIIAGPEEYASFLQTSMYDEWFDQHILYGSFLPGIRQRFRPLLGRFYPVTYDRFVTGRNRPNMPSIAVSNLRRLVGDNPLVDWRSGLALRYYSSDHFVQNFFNDFDFFSDYSLPQPQFRSRLGHQYFGNLELLKVPVGDDFGAVPVQGRINYDGVQMLPEWLSPDADHDPVATALAIDRAIYDYSPDAAVVVSTKMPHPTHQRLIKSPSDYYVPFRRPYGQTFYTELVPYLYNNATYSEAINPHVSPRDFIRTKLNYSPKLVFTYWKSYFAEQARSSTIMVLDMAKAEPTTVYQDSAIQPPSNTTATLFLNTLVADSELPPEEISKNFPADGETGTLFPDLGIEEEELELTTLSEERSTNRRVKEYYQALTVVLNHISGRSLRRSHLGANSMDPREQPTFGWFGMQKVSMGLFEKLLRLHARFYDWFARRSGTEGSSAVRGFLHPSEYFYSTVQHTDKSFLYRTAPFLFHTQDVMDWKVGRSARLSSKILGVAEHDIPAELYRLRRSLYLGSRKSDRAIQLASTKSVFPLAFEEEERGLPFASGAKTAKQRLLVPSFAEFFGASRALRSDAWSPFSYWFLRLRTPDAPVNFDYAIYLERVGSRLTQATGRLAFVQQFNGDGSTAKELSFLEWPALPPRLFYGVYHNWLQVQDSLPHSNQGAGFDYLVPGERPSLVDRMADSPVAHRRLYFLRLRLAQNRFKTYGLDDRLWGRLVGGLGHFDRLGLRSTQLGLGRLGPLDRYRIGSYWDELVFSGSGQANFFMTARLVVENISIIYHLLVYGTFGFKVTALAYKLTSWIPVQGWEFFQNFSI